MEKLSYNSSFEGEFVKYYEMYYYGNNKSVVQDTIDYIDRIYNCHVNNTSKAIIIDIGCGTGVFEEGFSKSFDNVVALDLSDDMIGYAKRKHHFDNVEYLIHNICDTYIDKQADMAVALSHVIGYQLSNAELNSFIVNVSKSLKQGGLFVFSFYNGPAILRSELLPRRVEKTVGDVIFERESKSTALPMENALINKYIYRIKDEMDSREIEISIEEKMRYFSFMELENYLSMNGMRIIAVKKYMSDEDLTEKEWNGCIIAVKE